MGIKQSPAVTLGPCEAVGTKSLNAVNSNAEVLPPPSGQEDCMDCMHNLEYWCELTEDCGHHSLILTQAVASFLEEAVKTRERQHNTSNQVVGHEHMLPLHKLTPFHGLKAPPISIHAYVERLAKYAKCSPVCFVLACCYMDRLAKKDKDLQPCQLSVHRLLVTGVLVAAKLMDDNYYNNAYYAKVGGITTAELNKLEMQLLQLSDFKMRVATHEVLQQLQVLLGPRPTPGVQRSKKRVSEDSADIRQVQPPCKLDKFTHALIECQRLPVA